MVYAEIQIPDSEGDVVESFTDYVVLRAFQKRADGPFSYLWYGFRYTDTPFVAANHARRWTSFRADEVPDWRLEDAVR